MLQGEGQSIESLLAAASNGKFDLVIHIGEFHEQSFEYF